MTARLAPERGAPPTDGCAARIPVRTRREPVERPEPLALYRSLAGIFGRDQVYLLESPRGPVRDCRLAAVGFGQLLVVTVARGVVEVEGVPTLRTAALRAIAEFGEPDGVRGLRLREPADAWQALRRLTTLFDAEGSPEEFVFGFLAFFGYDAARYIERLPYLIQSDSDLPDITLVLHQGMVRVDLESGTATLLVHESPAWPPLPDRAVRSALRRATAPADREPAGEQEKARSEPPLVRDEIDYPAYQSNVAKCLEHIAVGDIYQVQIGHEIEIESDADPVDVYRRLLRRNASPYMYLAPLAGHTVIGASPELLVRVEDGLITMRPIAGTIPRSDDDEATAATLRADPKEIAEHVMLVDLCRNDIGRVCASDTLDVPEMLTIEQYSHVQHLVSTVTARAAPGVDAFDVVRAVFPAGTMTGAPKIRAMEIIEDTETSRRGLYAGALGLIDVGGYTNLALCIRTLVHRGGYYRTRASAGVVSDSAPDREWRETLAKAGSAFWAVTGRELI